MGKNTIVEATFEYSIRDFQESRTYGIAPVFADKRGNGRTFNALRRMTDVLALTEPQGRVELLYPISREWSANRLTRPIELRFFLVEEAPSGISRVIGSVGPFVFEVEGK